jgi:dethiobiotin synthetase
MAPLDLRSAAGRVRALADERDLVLVEGAGGLLVRYDEEGATVADLAHELAADVLVVVDPSLGTLNHTALTLEALTQRYVSRWGVVIGSWPTEPGLAERCNLSDLQAVPGAQLVGVLPEGAASASPADFLQLAWSGLAPVLGGSFDAAGFIARTHAPAPEQKATE